MTALTTVDESIDVRNRGPRIAGRVAGAPPDVVAWAKRGATGGVAESWGNLTEQTLLEAVFGALKNRALVVQVLPFEQCF